MPRRERELQLPWSVIYYQALHGSVPAIDFLSSHPGKVEGEFAAVLEAVAAAPLPRFSGGGKWEAMRGTMSSWHEIRLTGPGREQFRLFCLLENGSPAELARRGLRRLAIAAITGMRKPWRTTSPTAITSVFGSLAKRTSATTSGQ
jgi:hypothetical protein